MPRPVPRGLTSLRLPSQASGQTAKKDRDPAMHGKLNRGDPKGRRLSMVPGSYTRDGPRKPGKGSILVLGSRTVPGSGLSEGQEAQAGLRAVAPTSSRLLCTVVEPHVAL